MRSACFSDSRGLPTETPWTKTPQTDIPLDRVPWRDSLPPPLDRDPLWAHTPWTDTHWTKTLELWVPGELQERNYFLMVYEHEGAVDSVKA